MSSIRASTALALALSLPIGAHAVSPAKPPAVAPASEDKVRSLLSGYEQVPSRESWQKMPGDVTGTLIRLSADRKQSIIVRARACEVLGWMEPVRAVPALRAALEDTSNAAAQRAGAVTGLIRAQSTKEQLATLGKTLADEQPLVRYRSAIELKRMNTSAARQILSKRRSVETEGSVKRVIDEALRSGEK